MGNSPGIIRRYYKDLVTPESAREWFNLEPTPRKSGASL